MRVSLKSLFAAGLAIGVLGSAASAVTITSTVEQSGEIDLQILPTHILTSGLGYDFTAQNPAQLTTIDSITVQLTANDGDTGVGEFDNNNLFLTLDGINTGLALNGLLNNQISTMTLTQVAPGTAALILAALQADGRLVGGVLDTDIDGPVGDIIGFPNAQGNIFTTLDITGQVAGNGGGGPGGVPLPAAALVAPLGAGLAGMYSRRFRKAK